MPMIRSNRYLAAMLLIAVAVSALVFCGARLYAQDQTAAPQDQAAPPQDQAPADQNTYEPLSKEQLGRLVAPIALYPDALVAQILAASSNPSQIVDANEWLKAHPGLTPADLGAQVDKQPWDPSVKALVQYPSVLANLSSNLGWTSELGDAYFNQPKDVMKAVQEMRKKAKSAGNLKSTSQLNVQDEDGKVVIDPVDPNVVYVPEYDPWLVYGYPIAPWPYWVEVPGIWWDGPGIYFGIGFPLGPFFGFGWGWPAWGFDWGHYNVWYHHNPYFARGPAFFNRGAYYGGRGDFYRPGNLRPMLGDRNAYRGYTAPRDGPGVRSGAFNGIEHGGGVARGFSARGQSSSGGFHGGGFGGGGFHGGGGGRH
jgi:Protein of unknown function (DUF3300)